MKRSPSPLVTNLSFFCMDVCEGNIREPAGVRLERSGLPTTKELGGLRSLLGLPDHLAEERNPATSALRNRELIKGRVGPALIAERTYFI